MRLDEMIIKANSDGKTYYCAGTDMEYSKEKGFTTYNESEKRQIYTDIICTEDWKEKQLRHLTVSEAEKELDCAIDAPDISKLFISPDVLPEDGLKIILFSKTRRACDFGFYDATDKTWKRGHSEEPIAKPLFYMKQSALTGLLPKE